MNPFSLPTATATLDFDGLRLRFATTDADRAIAQRFLAHHLPGIHPDAVPLTATDEVFRPLIVLCSDQVTGAIVGAALSCTSVIAAFNRFVPGYEKAIGEHSDLDLIAVAAAYRRQGVGSAILGLLEAELRRTGVKVWFGKVGADVPGQTADFFEENGFVVRATGEGQLPFFGMPWISQPMPRHHFYKKLR